MTETIRYSLIGQEDLALGTGSFEVELADGRHVILTQLDVGRILANPAVSSPFRLQAYERLALPDVTDAGLLARVNNDVGGMWMSGGLDSPWMALNGEVANVKDPVFGAVGDGVTDDTAAINAALATGKVVFLPPGIYLISASLVMTLNGTVIRGSGIGLTTIFCANAADFQRAISATALTNVAVRDLTVDLNQGGRSGALSVALVGIGFEDCVESSVVNCLVKNGLGHTTLGSGVGINFGGANTRRGLIRGCIIRDCGVAGKASDAVYTKGQQNLIVGCIALNCNDTAFVIENSDHSGIIGCTVRGCASGGAITAAVTGTYTGNYIDGLTIYDWSASVSGGLQLGALSGIANLSNTTVSNVIMERVAGSGPAINVKQEGGLTDVVLIRNCRINGSGTAQQGILIRGTNVTVTGCHIDNVGSRCIQVEVQSSSVLIANNFLRTSAVSELISGTDTDDLVIMNNVMYGDSVNTTRGVYFFGTAQRCHVVMNVIYGVTIERIGHDAGTVPFVVQPDTNGRGGVMVGGSGSAEGVGIICNALFQLGLNELAPSRDIKWGRPIAIFGADADAPPFISGTQVAWLRVVDSSGFKRMIPLFDPIP
jgi:Pectate lyase superfamily protein/Right handed beta helix region